MSDEQITIIIKGRRKSGKTTIAFSLVKALTDLGINASLLDDNSTGIVEEDPKQVIATLDTRLDALVQRKTPVLIQTQPLPRKGAA